MDETFKSVGTTSAESARISNRRYARTKGGREVIKAKRKVENARRRGDLKPPSACPSCGRHVKLDFHHDSTYTPSKGKDATGGNGGNQLRGKWRCRRCHSNAKTSDGKHMRSGQHMRDARKKAERTKAKHGTYGLDGKKK